MKNYGPLYRTILEREDSILQDYVTSGLADSQEHFTRSRNFISQLSVSDREKKLLLQVIEYYRILVEQSLQSLSDNNKSYSRAMRILFLKLSPEEQQEIVTSYRNSKLFIIEGGKQ